MGTCRDTVDAVKPTRLRFYPLRNRGLPTCRDPTPHDHYRARRTSPAASPTSAIGAAGLTRTPPNASSHCVWRPAVATAEAVPHGTGMHELGHFYASLLIRHGESVKTVQARLGHATAAETLDLLPSMAGRGRHDADSRRFRAQDRYCCGHCADKTSWIAVLRPKFPDLGGWIPGLRCTDGR
jgi:integrase